MRPLSYSIYRAASHLAAPMLRRLLAKRVVRGKEIAERLPERFGIDATPRPQGTLLWLHAASVGETMSVLPVLSALPPSLSVLVTTGTVTSAQLLAQRLPNLGLSKRVFHRFVPLDVPEWVERFLDHWRPDAGALVESELWPNLILAARARSIPMALLNARLSAGSARGWGRASRFARYMLESFSVIAAQSEQDAARLRALGASATTAPGNLKFAAAPLPASGPEVARLRDAIANRPVFLAASTHDGEEAVAIAAHRIVAERFPDLLTIIAPRHPERGDAISALAGDAPRRSRGELPGDSGFWIADTLGEMGLFYRLAPLAFIGGSIAPRGGQNPLEAARLGCVVACGPHMENQAEAASLLEDASALTRISDATGLATWLSGMLSDIPARQLASEAAIRAANRNADLPRQFAATLAVMAGVPPA